MLRYKYDADRIRSALGACLIKAGATRAYPGEEITINTDGQGKPYIMGRSGYEFNLSHSGSLIVFAEDEAPVGVDVEYIKEKDWKIFHRYLTEKEMSMIGSAYDPLACFIEVWTVREAFAKEEGLGLKILDEDFLVDYDSRVIAYDGRRLFYRTFEHTSDERYRISICSPHEISECILTVMTKADWDCLLKSIRMPQT